MTYFHRPAKGCTCGKLKDLANALACLGRAFDIILHTNLLCDSHALHINDQFVEMGHLKITIADLLWGHGSLECPPKLFNCSHVLSEILLTPNKDNGQTSTEVQ